MNQSLFSLSLLLFLFSSLYSITTLAQAPAASPPKPIVPSLPQSPSSDSSDSPSDDIITILRKAKSYSVLIRLLKTTQLINQINSQLITTTNSGGLTIFAPDDGSFSRLKPGFLNSLDDNQKIELLQFHVLPVYVSSTNFDSLTNPVRTLAGDNPARLQLNVTAFGNSVNVSTGVVNATVTGVVYMDKVLAIYHVDKVLLPLDFFRPKPPAPAPSLAMAPKTDNSTIDDDDDQVGTSKHSSGAISLGSIQGTTLVSIGVALAVLVAMSS